MIDRFWKKAESLLKKSQSRFSGIFRGILDDVYLLLKAYEIDAEKLKKPLSYKDKTTFNRQIRRWKEEGSYSGQFKVIVDNHRKTTYDDFILIMVLYYFFSRQKSVIALGKSVAKGTAEDVKKQAEEDYGGELPRVTEPMIDKAMFIAKDNVGFADYITLMLLEDADETMVQLRSWLQAKVQVTKERLMMFAEKLRRKLVSFKNDRLSGGLVHIIRSLANKIYVELFKKKDADRSILFIAEMDERTTPMCRSLHLQRFSPTGLNVFKRYSAEAGRVVKYEVEGMVEGINLPAITDHFHWCRSRVMYVGKKANE